MIVKSCVKVPSFKRALVRSLVTWERALTKIETDNGQINAFTNVQSQDILQKQAESCKGPLAAIPVAVKDNICTTDLPTTCASQILKDFSSPYDATAVSFLRQAGAVIVGKTNMDEFGMGSANIFSHFGPVHNPKDIARVAGGSSGGSAAAVAADMCSIALGSDTGGSVRLPASYCGVVGFKPSYGRISRYGLVTYANSLDTIGILARSVEDVKQVYDVISKYDTKDPTCMLPEVRQTVDPLDDAVAAKWKAGDLSGLVIGIPQEYYVKPLDVSILEIWRKGIRQFRELGATVVSINLPHTKLALSAYFTIALAEASSNLARYDGVRYGFCSNDTATEGALYAQTRSNGFGPEVKRRIMLGTHVLTAGTYDKHFLPAQKARRLVQQDFDQVFIQPNILNNRSQSGSYQTVHAILTPCAISAAPSIVECTTSQSAAEPYLNDVMTVPASLAGLPAISVPFGESNGYPVGLQLITQYGYDRFLLQLAQRLINDSTN
ncbi:hypothetical protein VTP01DRAFT_8639 [Rhizomucor pusillus]|uniref:uncharacterized protein n=1 Tax=Rhizomucor pusillus TaxID=4840 RepID=UPI00374434C8